MDLVRLRSRRSIINLRLQIFLGHLRLVLPLLILIDLDLLLPALFSAEGGVSVHVDVVVSVKRGFAEEAGLEEIVRLIGI